MRPAICLTAALIATVCSTSASLAGHATKVNGTITYAITHISDAKMPEPGWTLSRDVLVGTIKAAVPGSAIDGSQQTCIGAIVMNAGKTVNGKGYCDTVDKDGDVWWLNWSAEPKKSWWIVVGGTGKYKGLRGQGTTFYPGDQQAAQPAGWSQGYVGRLIFK